MANEKFELDFKSDDFGKVSIDEPGGYNSLDLNLNQKDKLYGRDISFSGGEFMLEFYKNRNHYLEKLLFYHQFHGYESVVEIIITPEIGDPYIGELDFVRAVTNDFDYVKMPIIQQSKLQIIKRRKSVKVDLLSNKDVDGNPITPLMPKNTLLRSKPVIQNSEYSLPEIFNYNFNAAGGQSTRLYQFNPAVNIVKYGVEDTLTFFENVSAISTFPGLDAFPDSNFKIIQSKNNLKKLEILIENLTIDFNTDTDNGGNGYVDFELVLMHGKDYGSANKIILLSAFKRENESFYFQGNLAHTIDSLQREDSVWLFFSMKVRQSATRTIGTPRFETFTSIKTMSVKIKSESTSYNSITPSLRLIDVMRQVIKSYSGLDIIAPRFDLGGEFYDNRLFNGNFLRGISDKGFNISLEDIEKSLPEFNADYELGSDGKVFFGIEKDFYRANQIAFFDHVQFSDLDKVYNKKFTVNEFYYNYKRYQSLKENEEIGSADDVHGESRFVFFNKNVEEKKEVSIEWIRSAFLIEEVRRKAILLTDETATQDDDNLFILDTINIGEDMIFEETTELQHEYQSQSGFLTLRNKGDINFIALGIEIGTSFTIFDPDQNSGVYTVRNVSKNTLDLQLNIGSVNSNTGGIRITKYRYVIDSENVSYINYTNQQFTQIDNLNAPEQYSNLRYSLRRNIQNYWKQYLATVNLYHKSKPVSNNWYKNNGQCQTTYNGLQITEKSDIITERVLPLLSPFIYNEMIFANVDLSDYKTLETKIRSERGYIRAIDHNNRVIKLFPVSLKYDILKKELTVKGEEKFEPVDMGITTQEKFVVINNETYTQRNWEEGKNWKIENDKLYIFDNGRQRLYNGIYYNRVAINGSKTDDIKELRKRLLLI